MEKKKLLLVAISVGVFLVLTIGAALLVFTPKNTNLPFETIASNSNPENDGFIPQSTYQYPIVVGEQQSSSIDVVDLVRNPGGVPGLVTPLEGVYSQANETGRGAENVISVTQPTTAAVPNTPPTGRAANQSAPAATRPAQTTTTPAQTTPSPSQTTSTPAQTTTSPSQSTSTPASTTTSLSQTTSTPASTTTSPSQTASTPARTTSSPSQTASTPAQTTTSPSQTASTPAQTTTTPAQTASTQTIPVVLSQSNTATQTGIYDDFWVQTGAFSTIASAESVKETLASKGITSIIENGIIDGRTLFRVRVGPYTSRNEANYWLALIKSMDGFEDSQVRLSDNIR